MGTWLICSGLAIILYILIVLTIDPVETSEIVMTVIYGIIILSFIIFALFMMLTSKGQPGSSTSTDHDGSHTFIEWVLGSEGETDSSGSSRNSYNALAHTANQIAVNSMVRSAFGGF